MCKYNLAVLLFSSCVLTQAASVQTFLSQSDFNDSVRSGSFTTESFAGLVYPGNLLSNGKFSSLAGREAGVIYGAYTVFSLPQPVHAIGFDLSANFNENPMLGPVRLGFGLGPLSDGTSLTNEERYPATAAVPFENVFSFQEPFGGSNRLTSTPGPDSYNGFLGLFF